MIPKDESVILDTNVLLTYVRGNELAKRIESEFELLQRKTKPIICVVSKGEILALAYRLNWQQAKRDRMIDLLSSLVIADIANNDVLNKYAEIKDYLYRLKPSVTIQHNDMWISAVAATIDAHVLSMDTDFKWLDSAFIKLHLIDPRL